MSARITDHVWRAMHYGPRGHCAYLNCRRPAKDHERSYKPGLGGRRKGVRP